MSAKSVRWFDNDDGIDIQNTMYKFKSSCDFEKFRKEPAATPTSAAQRANGGITTTGGNFRNEMR